MIADKPQFFCCFRGLSFPSAFPLLMTITSVTGCGFSGFTVRREKLTELPITVSLILYCDHRTIQAISDAMKNMETFRGTADRAAPF
nr:hypothetical protein [uncultured Ruminococcus sp.]